MNVADALNYASFEVHEIAILKGWYDTKRDIPELLCLIHSEVSEALEAARTGNHPSEKIPGHSKVAEELADCVIRILDMASYLKIDIGNAVKAKIEFNRTRSYRHGNKVY
jgi:NTP pyrophosphatase (non-canonical NTP hydrolase)